MSRVQEALRRAQEDLAALSARFALVGGLAVSVRTEPRFTRDVDLAVAVDDDREAERLVRALRAADYESLAAVEQEATGRLATVRLRAPSEPAHGIVVDLLFASSGVEPEIVAAAEPLEVMAGLSIPVARIGHLIAQKLLARDDARRPQDGVDLRALLTAASDEELERARAAARLIDQRGFGRDRNVEALLDELIASR